MANYVFPEEITRDYLEELAERLSYREAQFLANSKASDRYESSKRKMEAQVPAVSELLAQYTENQYVQQEVEIMPGLKASFRTLIPQNMDDALDFAVKHSDNADNYTRVLRRIRLAYGLESINGRRIGEPHFPGSYFDVMASFENSEDFLVDMRKSANSRFNQLSIHGLSEKLEEAFGVWETVVWDRINGIEDLGDTLKKSTGASDIER